MNRVGESRPGPWRERLARTPWAWWAIALVVVLSAALGFSAWKRKFSDWDTVYVTASQRLAAGQEILQQSFVYPPVNAYLALPMVGWSNPAARAVWMVVNVAVLAVFLAWSWRLAGGGSWWQSQPDSIPGEKPEARREWLVLVLGLATGIYFCLDALTNQQTDLIVALVVVLGCWALVHRRDLTGGALIGVAAGIKCTPLLWAPYLAWKRRWAAAALVGAVAVGINLLPDLTHPREGREPRLVQWARLYLAPMAGQNHDPGTWASSITFNHSLAGLQKRLWVHQRPEPGSLVIPESESRVSPRVLKGLVYGSCLALMGAAVLASWHSHRTGGDGRTVRRESFGLEVGLVLLLMVFLSPHSSKPHFCTLVLPGFCLARVTMRTRSPVLSFCLVGAILCGLASNKDLVGAALYNRVMWLGSVTWAGLLLFAGCAWALAFADRKQAAQSLPESEPETLRQAA